MRIYVLYLDVYFLENVLLNLVSADIHIDSYRQTYSLHKTSECITDRGNDGDSANHITASLRYRIYFADFADRIACDYNCIGNEEYVRTMDSNAAFLCNVFCLE